MSKRSFSPKHKTFLSISKIHWIPKRTDSYLYPPICMTSTTQIHKFYPAMARPPDLNPLSIENPPGQRGRGAGPDAAFSHFSTVLTISASITNAIQRIKMNRTEALDLGRRVQVLLDLMEPLHSDQAKIHDLFGKNAAIKLTECLERCAKAVGVQTNQGTFGRVIRVQSDASILVALSQELNECVQLLGLDIQLHENQLDVRGLDVLLFFTYDADNFRSQRPNYHSEYQQV